MLIIAVKSLIIVLLSCVLLTGCLKSRECHVERRDREAKHLLPIRNWQLSVRNWEIEMDSSQEFNVFRF
ncbi:hypothetical protein Ple7327_0951 [Pleurocapsa sp. PCC 7327]|nr:hypothetical protein Ple7327_0951 [Pleurocapsa sp. PCC 7327]